MYVCDNYEENGIRLAGIYYPKDKITGFEVCKEHVIYPCKAHPIILLVKCILLIGAVKVLQ